MANDATTSERLLRLVEWNITRVMPEKRDSPVQSSYQFEQLFGLQDVLLHLVCIGLHAGDQQSQVIGLSSGWKHKSQSAQDHLRGAHPPPPPPQHMTPK